MTESVLTDNGVSEASLVSRRRAFQLAGAAALSATALATALSSSARAEITLPTNDTALDDADRALVGYAVSLELACVALYDAMIPKVSGDVKALGETLRNHHDVHGKACAALAGSANPNVANATMLAEYIEGFTNADVATAWDVEERMVASHLFLLGVVKGTKASETLAAIINADAAHAAVLASLSGNPALVEVERTAGVFAPADYAVVI
jgi:hypothetical protein